MTHHSNSSGLSGSTCFDLPEWTTSREVIDKYPELHHYTGRNGLAGILQSNSIWATHYTSLNDSSEVVLAKERLIKALAPELKDRFLGIKKFSFRRRVKGLGGFDVYAFGVAEEFIGANYKVAIAGYERQTLAPPYFCSFCGHSKDNLYERENGLLSQWRGYGQEGRFAIVFETSGLDVLLKEEWIRCDYTMLSLNEVSYFDPSSQSSPLAKSVVSKISDAILELTNGNEDLELSYAHEFFTLLSTEKHCAFREEHEVRIIAMPLSEVAYSQRNIVQNRPTHRKIKRFYLDPKPHISLFEEMETKLPIKRLIVGPGINQDSDYEFARQLIGSTIPIYKSASPFVG